MSKIEVDAIDKQSGSTLTLGGSGTAVTLASGATQSGFGRTGTVDWQTTPKTGDFTGVNGEGYFINTTSGGITMTLPSASAGDIISIQDYNNTFDTNNFIIQAGSGVKINGGLAAGKLVLGTEGQGLTLIYVDVTVGWRSIESTTFSSQSIVPTYIAATGGTITTSGSFKIHTFTGPGTFTVCSVGNACGSNSVDYLVVAGGGGASGGEGPNSNYAAGGGAGGYRESSGTVSGNYTISPLGACVSALPVSATGYPITVGGGGAGVCGEATSGNPGNNSVFSTITSAGGGHGAPGNPAPTGGPGGSGGGGAPSAGAGNTPPVSPPQGSPGGVQSTATPSGGPPNYGRGGGGGATAPGANGSNVAAGNGGAGATSSINGTPTGRAGGGAGGIYSTGGSHGTAGTATDGGGNGGIPGSGTSAEAGTANTGGGAGGQGTTPAGPAGTGPGKAGGSGSNNKVQISRLNKL
jgi:hypothetical protein